MEIAGTSVASLFIAGIALLAWLLGHLRGVRIGREAATALLTRDTTLRLLRLSATDQRNVALALLGHAETARPPDPALVGLARRLLDMSEDLIQQTDTPAALRFLAEEDMRLMPVVEFAMAQVAAHLGPSRRAWRLDPAFERTRLLADRRAINQILVNVMAGAAASTRDGDWIEVSAETGDHGWAVVVQDEGIGLPVVRTDENPQESRGIGLQLTLARSLMKAHGGSLIVDSTEGVGTRVCLRFPPERLLAPAA